MGKMLGRHEQTSVTTAIIAPSGRDWRQSLPVLAGRGIRMRELEPRDATALLAMLSASEVSRFISPAPSSVPGFERFIAWAREERAAGQYLCFAVVLEGTDTPVGLFQIRQTEPGFTTGEWGFALDSACWGTGIFAEAAGLLLDFAFDVVGVHRLEARSVVQNGRGNGALRKLGALQEGILRRSFLRNGEYLDQVLWTIVASDRRESRACSGPRLRVH